MLTHADVTFVLSNGEAVPASLTRRAIRVGITRLQPTKKSSHTSILMPGKKLRSTTKDLGGRAGGIGLSGNRQNKIAPPPIPGCRAKTPWRCPGNVCLGALKVCVGSIADMCSARGNVRIVPIADIMGHADHFGLGISICIGMSAGVSMLWPAGKVGSSCGAATTTEATRNGATTATAMMCFVVFLRRFSKAPDMRSHFSLVCRLSFFLVCKTIDYDNN